MIDAGKGNLPGVSRCRGKGRGNAHGGAGRRTGYASGWWLKNSPGVRPINWRKAAMNAEVES